MEASVYDFVAQEQKSAPWERFFVFGMTGGWLASALARLLPL